MNKYRNRKQEFCGELFDSKRELKRWQELRLLERSGAISNLQRQVSFPLLPKQEGERAVTYKADFVYLQNGQQVVEDVKGVKTPAYILKRKMMLYFHRIRISEI